MVPAAPMYVVTMSYLINVLCISRWLIQFSFLKRGFHVNPGDYASGRDGFDAVVTQMMNQIDGFPGPPPMANEKIVQIPIVSIDQQQVG